MSTGPTKRCRTYRYRLHPTTRQIRTLTLQLDLQRELYNAALEERIGAWRWERRSVTLFDQQKSLTGLKEVRPEIVSCGIVLCRGTLTRLDRAFASFHRRIRSGETPGFPRFRSADRWDSLQWDDLSGWKLTDGHRLRLKGIGEIKINYHRAHLGIPKAITVKREGRKWWLSVRCVDVPALPLPSTGREVGIDMGVVNIISTSDCELIVGEHYGEKAKVQLSSAQRRLAAKQRGSNRRRTQVDAVSRLHRKVGNQRRNAAHQLSRRLVNDFDFIAIEDLNIINMTKSPHSKSDPDNPGNYLPNGRARKTGLNRSIYDSGWGNLALMISYKAESAGRIVMKVNPCQTSQRCAKCGHIEGSNRVSQAAFCCQSCGHQDHADINAARNILWAGRALRDHTRVGSK